MPPPPHLKARLKNSYDLIAPQYNKWTTQHNSLRLSYLNKLLPSLLQKDNPIRVLELGCGCGLPVSAKLLSYPNISVTANDLSSTQIALAKENLKDVGEGRVTFVEGDMLNLDFAEGFFDAVVAFYSIIHLPRDEQVVLLGRIAKWLKKGGFLVANFSEEELVGLEMEKWLGEEGGWMFWAGWGRERTVAKIRDAGFEIVREEVVADVADANFLWVIAKRLGDL